MTALSLALLGMLPLAASERAVFVDRGQPKAVFMHGVKWQPTAAGLSGSGVDNFLIGVKAIGAGDFQITVDLTIDNLGRSAASLMLGPKSHFGFDGGHGGMFLEGPLFADVKSKRLGPHSALFAEGKPLHLEAVRKGAELRVLIGGKEVCRQTIGADALGLVALRPWRSTMRVEQFEVVGQLVDLPQPGQGFGSHRPDEKLVALDRQLAQAGQIDVYRSGENGYHTYRIPSLLVTKRGSVLAFSEGRKAGGGDAGDIDLLVKRSTDGGRTFAAQQVVWDDGPNTCGNPCPVVDQQTGLIWLLMTHNLGEDHEPKIIARTGKSTRTVWVCHSDDDGRSWSRPQEITTQVKQPQWTWYATGPGAGIQLRSGRLVIPCDHIDGDTKAYCSHVIYSDDHGQSWKRGGAAGPACNECEVVELSDGQLLLNMRNYDRQQKDRAVARSRDGGLTWSAICHDAALIEPLCQASIRRYRLPTDGKPGAILFANPADTRARQTLTVRASFDDCRTWPAAKVVWPGPAAYCCLAVLPGGEILCLYERGLSKAYERISLRRLNLDELENSGEPKAESEK